MRTGLGLSYLIRKPLIYLSHPSSEILPGANNLRTFRENSCTNTEQRTQQHSDQHSNSRYQREGAGCWRHTHHHTTPPVPRYVVLAGVSCYLHVFRAPISKQRDKRHAAHQGHKEMSSHRSSQDELRKHDGSRTAGPEAMNLLLCVCPPHPRADPRPPRAATEDGAGKIMNVSC